MQAKVSGRVVQVDDPKKNKAGVESHQVHLLQSGKYEPEIVSINCRNGWLPKVGDAVEALVSIRLFEGDYGAKMLVSYVAVGQQSLTPGK